MAEWHLSEWGWDHVVCTDCFGGRQEGPAGSGRRALWLAKPASQPANQPDTHIHTHKQTRSHSAWLEEDCTQKKCWELHTTLRAIKKIYFTASVVWLWLLQGAVCQCVSAELVHGYKHNTQRSVKNTFRPPVYMGTVLRSPTELTEIQSFRLTCSQDLVKIAAYLQQNCPISLNATCRKKSLFVGSQVLALRIIHDHRSYWFSLVFLCLITHC